MAEKLTITIDGKPCECEKGEYLWDVATRNGIGIPALCRSDAFDDHRASCRVCIVEVIERGWPKVVTSCIYPVNGEIEVKTASERILEERAVVMGLLAARAPESSLIADMSSHLGNVGAGRFVTLEGETCILCGKCVQACDSMGTGAISTVNRGTDKMIDTPYGKASDDCIGCLSCATVCPTGSITYTETDSTRTIWNREFDLERCEACNAVLGTKELVAHARNKDAGDSLLCDECRKQHLADEMMATYRNL